MAELGEAGGDRATPRARADHHVFVFGFRICHKYASSVTRSQKVLRNSIRASLVGVGRAGFRLPPAGR